MQTNPAVERSKKRQPNVLRGHCGVRAHRGPIEYKTWLATWCQHSWQPYTSTGCEPQPATTADTFLRACFSVSADTQEQRRG